MENLARLAAAFNAGKIPSTQQLNDYFDWLTNFAIPAAQPHEGALSGHGRVLAEDVGKILNSYKLLNSNKNGDNLLQDAIWHLTEGDVNANVDSSGQQQASADIKHVRSSLRTILDVVWSSLSSDGSFLPKDLSSFALLALSDVAEVVQDQASRTKDGLRDVEQEVQEGQRDSLGRDKERLEEEKDKRVAFEHRMETLKDAGSRAIGVGQSAKEKTKVMSDRTTEQLQDAYYKACERAQKDKAYHDALSTLFDTVHKWVSKAFDVASDQPLTLDTFIEDPSPEQHIHQALSELKTLLDRLANPESSVDALLDTTQRFVTIVRANSPEFKAWVDLFFEYAFRSLDNAEYPRSDEARGVRGQLGERGRALLDPDTEAGRAWIELQEAAQTFGAALLADTDVERVRAAHRQLGKDAQHGLVQAGMESNAVVQQALWFWRDLFAVYAPRFLAMLKDIPIPRTEYTDDDIEFVLENLDISSLALNPAHIFVRNTTDLDVHTSAGAEADTTVGTFTHIQLQAVQLTLQDVSFYYRDKDSKLPLNKFTGLLAMKMPAQGLDIDIKIRLIPPGKEREEKKAYHNIEGLTVQISNDVELNIRKSNHEITRTIFKPIFNKRFREALGRSLAQQLRVALNRLDAIAWDVGQRTEVFADMGAGRGAALAAAIWSEIGRLTRSYSVELRATGTGVVVEEQSGAKFAMGAEPQVLSGDKHGPLGTGSQSLEQRDGQPVHGAPADERTGKPAAEHVKGLVGEGHEQVKSFRRSVDEKSAKEKQSPGWKSSAFDI
ncbi:hypothetical protein C8F04DRAFT_1100661 [Mycena alexandri]|uniref:Uncharacterized protein n=1 Tax=Mycena alexandri TaxID=1745969 RepID=A0AAD6SVY7_9AGAR|nr:hypothetical protein C8F04DRAFT_1100661 [Mycena alexandri]